MHGETRAGPYFAKCGISEEELASEANNATAALYKPNDETEDKKEEVIQVENWIPTTRRLPKEGVIVDTKISDENGERNKQPLRRYGRLWFLPDGSMYVYYTPTHWREVS